MLMVVQIASTGGAVLWWSGNDPSSLKAFCQYMIDGMNLEYAEQFHIVEKGGDGKVKRAVSFTNFCKNNGIVRKSSE